MTDVSLPKLHDIAAGEINAWRGRCVDLFSRGERAIALALEVASATRPGLVIKHLAGQRLADLTALANEEEGCPERQRRALVSALESWLIIETKRAFLAHGVSTVLLDKHDLWYVQFDFTRYESKKLERLRWNCDKHEAHQFEEDLERQFKLLSSQLGHYRKRFTAQPL